MPKVFRYILILVLLQLTVEGNAQYKKPLSSPRKQLDNAMFNLGVTAGPNYTHWHHFDVAQADDWFLKNYAPVFQWGYTGGISFEAIFSKHLSAGINALYARHRISMQYTNEKFPYDWNNGQLLYKQRRYELKADYHTIEAALPVTFYFFNPKDIVRPYIFVAPRFSYCVGGNNIHTVIDSIPRKKPVITATDTVPFVPTNHISFNVGATMGIGTQFRINTDYYYFLIKLEALATWYFRNSFTEQQLENEFYNKRFDADVATTITFIFPLKKILKDACYIVR
ncbi:MAG: outer membrane beta-barrel protein [Bacteroidales bacterium]|nr:outer membrane beta-barrel protein [Bacteroidales bacterium]